MAIFNSYVSHYQRVKSKEVTLLQFSSEYDFSVSTQPQSIRGES